MRTAASRIDNKQLHTRPMSTGPTIFFANDDNLAALRHVLSALPPQSTGVKTGNVAPHLRQMLKVIVNNPSQFDQLCRININWIGQTFISLASDYKPDTEHSDSHRYQLFWMAYRFVCELAFGMPEDLSMELQQVKTFVDENLSTFPEDTKRQLVFANYLMPAAVAKQLLQHPDLAAMREFTQQQIGAADLKKQWDAELAQKEELIQALKAKLSELETGYNFVGLVQGFAELCSKKRNEKLLTLVSLVALAVLVTIPVLAEAVFIGLHLDTLDKYKQALLFALPPLITFEVLLVYFFRVVLVHFRSIKTQLLQLELRISLCQFIQSYSSYASSVKQKDASSLEKFETLIFSGLIANEDNLPSTFDGTEQLAKLIKSLKTPA